MARRIVSTNLWNGATVAGSSALTSIATNIESSDALALHLTAITGTTPSITFTYSLCCQQDLVNGVYTIPQTPVTIGATKAAADVMGFAPQCAAGIKIIATNNGTGAVVMTAYLVSQEAAA